MLYIIKDWAGNVMFNGELFESFEDADCFLGNFLDRLCETQGYDFDVERGEYYIMENK